MFKPLEEMTPDELAEELGNIWACYMEKTGCPGMDKAAVRRLALILLIDFQRQAYTTQSIELMGQLSASMAIAAGADPAIIKQLLVAAYDTNVEYMQGALPPPATPPDGTN
jgi:hypothetical protein